MAASAASVSGPVPAVYIGPDVAFGGAVAVSGDTALVGMPGRGSERGSFVGAAYVFSRVGSTWSLVQTLRAADGAAGDRFGGAVAVRGDTALVGAASHDVEGGQDAGAAYVFVRSGGVWAQAAKLVAADRSAWDAFGSAVALGDGLAVVGAPRAGGPDEGAAYVFAPGAGGWSEERVLKAADGAGGAQFGASVAVSGDTVIVGAPGYDSPHWADAGAAYVFTRPGAVWTEQAKLQGVGGQGDRFGAAVAVSGDAALVGAPGSDVAGQENPGAAQLFERSGEDWKSVALLEVAGFTRFGGAVALDGDLAAIGEERAGAGRVHFLQRPGASWSTYATQSVDGQALRNDFGRAVSLAGGTAVIGAPNNLAEGEDNPGAAYVYVRAGTTWRLQSPLYATGTRARPVILGFRHHYSHRGQLVVISGRNFGTTRGSSFVKFGSVKCTRYREWKKNRILTFVPLKARLGRQNVTVTTKAGGTSRPVECIVQR